MDKKDPKVQIFTNYTIYLEWILEKINWFWNQKSFPKKAKYLIASKNGSTMNKEIFDVSSINLFFFLEFNLNLIKKLFEYTNKTVKNRIF
jgi:hypothetical protein